MKLQFQDADQGRFFGASRSRYAVACESDTLTDVLLCPPSYLEPVPCCSRTCESVRRGFETSVSTALAQHEQLRQVLTARGVRCHVLPADETMPDLCFTRDVAVTTPWGIVLLNPATSHRAPEVGHVGAALAALGAAPISRVQDGHIEGGDICLARPGLLIIGVSHERTDPVGARSFAAPFKAHGWHILHCPLDPHFLHLDTVFCMLDQSRALACVDILDDAFLKSVGDLGIELVPTSYKEARDLGGNILSLDGKTILASSQFPRISSVLRRSGFETVELEIDQFAACGGGLHCLTMPLGRRGHG